MYQNVNQHLHFLTQLKTISITSLLTSKSFGHFSQVRTFDDSLLFFVTPCRHFDSNASELKSLQAGSPSLLQLANLHDSFMLFREILRVTLRVGILKYHRNLWCIRQFSVSFSVCLLRGHTFITFINKD